MRLAAKLPCRCAGSHLYRLLATVFPMSRPLCSRSGDPASTIAGKVAMLQSRLQDIKITTLRHSL